MYNLHLKRFKSSVLQNKLKDHYKMNENNLQH